MRRSVFSGSPVPEHHPADVRVVGVGRFECHHEPVAVEAEGDVADPDVGEVHAVELAA